MERPRTHSVESSIEPSEAIKPRSESNVDYSPDLLFLISPFCKEETNKDDRGNYPFRSTPVSKEPFRWKLETELEEEVPWKSSQHSVLLENFAKRGWKPALAGEPWNLFWAMRPSTLEQLFSSARPNESIKTGYLDGIQMINHFPNYYELSRKDLLVKHWREYRDRCQDNTNTTLYNVLSFVPQSFILPEEHFKFVNAFQRRASNNSDRPNYWIIKPANCSRGIGIRIIDRLDKIPISLRGNTEEHLIDKEEHRNQCNWSRSNFVVCEYISNPLLIYGKKFDLRIYVLATSFLPLKAFVYRKGFTRFCTEVYSNSSEQLDNQKIHLTNISLQKHSGSNGTNYRNSTLDLKWSLEKLKKYLVKRTGDENAGNSLWEKIKMIVLNSLLCVQNVIISDSRSFELFGFDILLDDNYNAFLMEINGSPSLTPSDELDYELKEKLISDCFDIVFHLSNSLGDFEMLEVR